MAAYIVVGLLLATLASGIQASPFPGEDEDCLHPIEDSYYARISDYVEPCYRLGDALIVYRDEYFDAIRLLINIGTYEEFKMHFLNRTGFDVDQDQDLIDFACRLADISTTDELAELFNAGEHSETIADAYSWTSWQMARFDGFHGFRMGLEVILAATNAVHELIELEEPFDPNTFAETVRSVDPALVASILAGLEEEFGSGYLVYGLFRPYNAALVGVDHHLLATAITNGDVACRLGVAENIELKLYSTVDVILYGRMTRGLVDLALELYVAADQAGLFHLR